MDIPAGYENHVSELLTKLMMTDEKVVVQEDPIDTKRNFEVTRVSGHRISDEGIWQFKVHFKGYQGGEWVDDSDCDCESHIRTYFDGLDGSIKTVYCICRVSSKNQAGPGHVSLEAQEQLLIRTAREKFPLYCQLRIKILKISASAYRGIPDVLQRVGNAAAPGDVIMIYRVDRLSRNIVKYLSFLEELNDYGVLIFAQDEDIWYSENKLEFIQGILDANKEAVLIGKRVKLSLEKRRCRGDEVLGSLPYGYKTERDKDNRVLRVHNLAEQNVINYIKRQLKKYSPAKVAEFLNEKGVKKRGRRWTAGMVKSAFDSC